MMVVVLVVTMVVVVAASFNVESEILLKMDLHVPTFFSVCAVLCVIR